MERDEPTALRSEVGCSSSTQPVSSTAGFIVPLNLTCDARSAIQRVGLRAVNGQKSGKRFPIKMPGFACMWSKTDQQEVFASCVDEILTYHREDVPATEAILRMKSEENRLMASEISRRMAALEDIHQRSDADCKRSHEEFLIDAGKLHEELNLELYLQLIKRTRRLFDPIMMWELFEQVATAVSPREDLKEFLIHYCVSTGLAPKVDVNVKRSALYVYDLLTIGPCAKAIRGENKCLELSSECNQLFDKYTKASFPIEEADHIKLLAYFLQAKYGHEQFSDYHSINSNMPTSVESKFLVETRRHSRAKAVLDFVKINGPIPADKAKELFIQAFEKLPYKESQCFFAKMSGQNDGQYSHIAEPEKEIIIAIQEETLRFFQPEDGLQTESVSLDDLLKCVSDGEKIKMEIKGDGTNKTLIFESRDSGEFCYRVNRLKRVSEASTPLSLSESPFAPESILSRPAPSLQEPLSSQPVSPFRIYSEKYKENWGEDSGRDNVRFATIIHNQTDVVLKFYTDRSKYNKCKERHSEIGNDYVVKLIDWFHEGRDCHCLVFERGEKTLKQWLAEGPEYCHKIGVLHGILKCLAHIHSMGIIHGDIKPSNVMRFSQDKWKLIDLDGSVSDRDYTTVIDYTTEYAAPEVVLWQDGYQRLTTAVDMFSLGIIVYEVLSGLNFYCEASKSKIQELLHNDDYSKNYLHLHRRERELIAGLTHKDPSRRLTAEEALKSALFKNVNGASSGTQSGNNFNGNEERWSKEMVDTILTKKLTVQVILEELDPESDPNTSFYIRSARVAGNVIDPEAPDTPTFLIKFQRDYRLKVILNHQMSSSLPYYCDVYKVKINCGARHSVILERTEIEGQNTQEIIAYLDATNILPCMEPGFVEESDRLSCKIPTIGVTIGLKNRNTACRYKIRTEIRCKLLGPEEASDVNEANGRGFISFRSGNVRGTEARGALVLTPPESLHYDLI